MGKLTIFNGENYFVEYNGQKNLLEVIRDNDFAIEATCGGNGTCGKCLVIVDGQPVKACKTQAFEGIHVVLPKKKSIEHILTQTGKLEIPVSKIFPSLDGDKGLAVDIGTTTIAAYLYDLFTGERLGVASAINPQKAFGADVISRIDYTMKGDVEREKMQSEIVACVQTLIDKLSQQISVILFTGNTTMMHFLLNLDARGIAVAPFTPESTDMHIFEPEKIGLVLQNAKAVVLPSVSAYVGADTISAIIATGIFKAESAQLLVDIGTNGEIALHAGDTVWACSTAAGPAFEGANITYGMPAVDGAISKVWIEEDQMLFKVIGDSEPKGMCGSGVLDMIAVLLEQEVIDFSGRIVDDDEVPVEWIAKRIVNHNNANAFQVSADILITQKDVREIQNAKAAICAGIMILVERAGIQLSDITHTFLAGGFGNFMDRLSATKIGLIPPLLEDTIVTAGNAAGQGASMALLNKDYLDLSTQLSKSIKYIELSFDPGFSDCYMENMMFGDE